MCWGSFHPTGSRPNHANGLLASAPGNLHYARCLVLDNADSVRVPAARGTIQRYGIDGVCHQVANQVLFAASPPQTISGARGYVKSVYIYGTYGRAPAAWAAKKTSCGASSTTSPTTTTMDHQDDFEAKARRILADREDLHKALLALRAQHHVQKDNLRSLPDLSAAAINTRHQLQMMEVATLIGVDHFREIFGFELDEPMNLVDPAIFEAARYYLPA